MSKPLSSRLDKIEADALTSNPAGHNVHIIRTIINPDHSVHEVPVVMRSSENQGRGAS